MRFHKYFFDDTDLASLPECIVHPRQALVLPGVDELLTRLACSAPGKITLSSLGREEQELAQRLTFTGVLRQEKEAVLFNCPIFAERDLPALRQLTAACAEELSLALANHRDELEAAVSMQQDGFSAGRHLYHLLCGSVLDGAVFDRLEMDGLVSVGKALPSGEDCLTILYEDCPALNGYSDGLLCSFNRLRTEQGTFSSFGDSRGSRCDMYRWFASRSGNVVLQRDIPPDKLLADHTLSEWRQEAGQQFICLLEGGHVPLAWKDAFAYFGYTEDGRVAVPVYAPENLRNMLSALEKIVLTYAYPGIARALEEVAACKALTAVEHCVQPQDIANEAYHLLFGQINEALVRRGIVTTPAEVPGQGRFLRCFERA